MTYGLPVQRNNDPFIVSIPPVFTRLAEAGSAGKYLVNIIPILKYIPDWVPGAAFKQEARYLREELRRIREEPFQRVLRSMVRPSVCQLLPPLISRGGQGNGT